MKILGNKYSNFLVGTDGQDAIKGRAGDDYILGREGIDILIGGRGADTFFVRADGLDAIFDFQPGKDTIVIDTRPEGDLGGPPVRPLTSAEFGATITYEDTALYYEESPFIFVGAGLPLSFSDFLII